MNTANSEITKRVGVIGLGKMGLPMARHLVDAGYTVAGYDPMQAAQAAAEKIGIYVKQSSAEVAETSDFLIVIVGFDENVDEVIFGNKGILTGDATNITIAIASTCAQSFMRDLPERADNKLINFVDIPVARGEMAAEAGELLVFGGGDSAIFERCTPILRAFSEHVFYLGPLGSGQTGKAVNNLILWACMCANDEGLILADALGVDREKLRNALLHSSADNWALRTRADERPISWAEKDMMIVLREADAARVALPLCGTVKEAIKAFKIKRNLEMPAVK